jgi:hypothetical protein
LPEGEKKVTVSVKLEQWKINEILREGTKNDVIYRIVSDYLKNKSKIDN